MEFLELALKYAVVPLLTIICTMGWSMHKKQESRIDALEKRTNDTEKAVIEIKSDVKYISKDIEKISVNIQKLVDRHHA